MEQLQKFFWGEIFYDETTRKFKRVSEGSLPRSFVHFILEPFYKLISASVSEEKSELERILKKENIVLKSNEYTLDIKPLVKLILRNFLGDLACLVDTLVSLPNSV